MKTSRWVLGVAIPAAMLGGILVAQTGAEEPPWFNKDTGEIRVELMPERIPMGSDYFKSGIAYLESRNFKESQNGPFLVFEFEDSKEPSFWYYKGVGIVPIGTKEPVNTLTTVGSIEDGK
ncbi:MAG: hypothetical protein NTZ21_18935 [Actinobacteria bacterium]|nr:hypothetical protein [Actinomycetota bacterium]